jgi:hypothetical protein
MKVIFILIRLEGNDDGPVMTDQVGAPAGVMVHAHGPLLNHQLIFYRYVPRARHIIPYYSPLSPF